MFDPRAHRDHAADAFRTHDGRQPWPIAIAASDHQQIVLIDGEASSAITTSPAAGAPTSGISTALTTSAGLPNASIWIAFMIATPPPMRRDRARIAANRLSSRSPG